MCVWLRRAWSSGRQAACRRGWQASRLRPWLTNITGCGSRSKSPAGLRAPPKFFRGTARPSWVGLCIAWPSCAGTVGSRAVARERAPLEETGLCCSTWTISGCCAPRWSAGSTGHGIGSIGRSCVVASRLCRQRRWDPQDLAVTGAATGGWLRPVITPDKPDKVTWILARRGGSG